jgi:branched-chain amino acid transport system substrate-binding protein
MITRVMRALAVAAGVATVVATTACGGGADGTVKFGVAGPLERFLGAQTLRGAQLAAEQINAGGGIRGRQLELAAVSDSASAPLAVAVADGFFADPAVVAVVGHSTSGAMLAAARIYDRGLPAISATATSPEITAAGPWVFRVCPSDATSAARLAGFALRELGRRAAILYANDAFGRGLREGFRRAFTEGGGSLLEEYPYIESETEDFTLYLERIRAGRPDLIFIAGLDIAARHIIRQARQLGIDAPILGGDGLLGLAGLDRVYDGTYVLLFYHPDAPDAASRQFVQAYRSVYGQAPDAYAALTYDAVMLLAQAARDVGFERERIRDYLASVGSRRPAYRGVSGLITFDENGDAAGKGFAVGRIAGDGIELVSVEGGS